MFNFDDFYWGFLKFGIFCAFAGWAIIEGIIWLVKNISIAIG